MADNANSSESATANEDTAIKPNTTADDANAWGSAAANDASWGTTDKDNTGQGSWADVPKENSGLLPLEAICLAKTRSVAVLTDMQSTFRTADQHAATLAYGEMRDHMLTVELARSTLSASVEISFLAIPGYVDKNQLPTKYIGFVNIMDIELIGQLFQEGATATLCFDEPNKFVEPKGWLCEVKDELLNVEHPGNLTLLVSRPKDSDLVVKTAKFASLAMTQESQYDVWMYPHGDDRACKRLVDCANKYLHGEEGESNAHLEKRMALQKFCSGREHTAMPKPTEISFDRNKLTAEQLAELETIEAECSPDQRAVLDKIYSCQSAVHVVQGPPGTGKTSFAAERLVPILNIFGLKTNCYASSNAATDTFVGKVSGKLKPMRYYGLKMELAGIYAAWQSQNNRNPLEWDDEPIFRQLTLELFEDTFKATNVIVAPCYLAAEEFFRKSTSPKIVIIDDAGSSRELETLMVMYNNLDSAKMFIILGDANQSPVVPSLNRKINEDDPNSPPYNIFAPQLATSFMARQIANGISHSTFTKI